MRPPRYFVYRGSVLASAYVISDTPAARATVLRRWKPGHEVHAWSPGKLLWLLPEAERTHCDAAPGLPLVSQHGRLTGAPLTTDELADLPPGIAVVEHGRLVARQPGAAVDVSAWLETARFAVAATVEPLGEPPPPPELGFVPRPRVDARIALGMAPLSSEGAAVQQSLRAGTPMPAQPQNVEAPAPISPAARSFFSGVRSVARWFRGLFRRREPNTSALAPPRQSWLDRLDAALTRMLDASRLTALFSQRQADYFARLMQMFEQGDLDQALRHAVPLADQRAPAAPARPLLGTPQPRASLDIPLRPAAPASGAYVVGDFYEQLRRRYRAAAEKLEAEGRYKEAAFVLAELLHADEEAIALLERHKQYELAAELAEARQMPPGMQVRQWFLAKNIPRAVAVARRHGVFGDAISRLSRTHHTTEAKQLRLLWADAFATSGDYLNAVVALEPLPDAKPLARRFIELGIAQGGPTAARLEVFRLVHDGDKADPTALLERLESDEPEAAAERAIIAAELQTQGLAVPGARQLARAAVRSVMRDAEGAPSPQLLELAADGALKADLPPHRLPDVKLDTRSPPIRVDIDGFDKGALAVRDAALLPDGRTVVALGEAGVRLLTRDGRTAAHFDVPAESLVPYDGGGRTLCLAARGEALVAARIDLAERKVEPLPQLSLLTWADGTDGSMWFVHDGQALCGLDLHEAKLRALWRVPMPAPYARPTRSALSLSVVPSPQPGVLEWWRYELSSLTLRNRQRLQLPQVNERLHVLPDGGLCVTQGGVAWHQLFASTERRQLVGLAGGVIVDVDGAGTWFSLVARSTRSARSGGRGVSAAEQGGDVGREPSAWEDGGMRWMLADVPNVSVRHVVQLPRSAGFRVRMRKDVAVWCDTDGRVLVVDLVYGRLLRSFRVR